MIRIYLAGPMENVNIDDARNWRNEIKAILELSATSSEIEFLDPTYRIFDHKPDNTKEIFELDLIEVERADFLIADLRNNKLAKHGTAIEVFYANRILNKPVIALRNKEDNVHPFLECCVTKWVNDIDDFVSVVEPYLYVYR
jgi:nucleoside 2-deoxyribosyltransferase